MSHDPREERVSSRCKFPKAGDSITVVKSWLSGECVKVIVHERRYVTGRCIALSYATRREPLPDGKTMLTGNCGTVRIDKQGLTWAWGWTTPEADALRTTAALAP